MTNGDGKAVRLPPTSREGVIKTGQTEAGRVPALSAMQMRDEARKER